MFLAFCNLAVFFQFNDYLRHQPTEAEWSGFLIGIFSLTVLIVRPIISPFMHARNARPWIAAGTCGIIAALVLYDFGTTVLSMAVVRVFHGLAYTVLAVAVLSGIVAVIPAHRSAQAFGMISVLTLLPYAVVPPIVEPLEAAVGGFDRVLDVFAVAMVLVFPLLVFGISGTTDDAGDSQSRVRWDDFVRNMRDTRIVSLLAASLLVWTAFTFVFFYLKGFGEQIGIVNVGWFFTLSTFSEIAVRLFGGPFLDRLDKAAALAVSLAWLAAAYVIMSLVSGTMLFYGMGVVFGLGWGLAMPMLSGLMFDISEPKLRALNTNLSMEMFQGGYFVGPIAGGFVLVHNGYPELFAAGCAATVGALICVIPLLKRQSANRLPTQHGRGDMETGERL